jgi:acetyl-CoA synthase
MSKLICSSAIDGAVEWVARADASLTRAVEAHGEDHEVGFPSTAYFLPVIHSFSGDKVETLADCRAVLKRTKELLPQRPSDDIWLPYLGSALDAGIASLFACEILEACKYLENSNGNHPVNDIWLGAASDVIIRERGIEFVDGTAPGFAAITGAAPSNEIAVKIARQLQEKSLYVFMAGSTNGKQFAEQLAEEGVQLGWETRLVPFGKDVSALIYALGFANRVALSFGNVAAADFEANLKYNKDRVFAFVGRGRHQLRLPGHRRHRHSRNPSHRRLHLRARGVERAVRNHGREGARGERLQGEGHRGAGAGALWPGLRR